MFIQLDPNFLAQIATNNDRIPTLYYSKLDLVRAVFWMRLRLIYSILQDLYIQRETCLDFGGGGGIFLPTLAEDFDRVFFLDLEDREARQVITHYNLSNIQIIKQDISQVNLPHESFDAIIAADVLEHFQDLSIPTQPLKSWLKPNGVLITSLPTENWIYQGLRTVFNIEKPLDHYHTGYEVEAYLESEGFHPIRRQFVPLVWNLFPLFLITVWRFKPPKK